MKRFLAIAALILGLAAAIPRNTLDVQKLAREVAREEDHVTAAELEQWIKQHKPGLRIIDLGKGNIPTSERMTIESLVKMRFQPHETIVLVSDGGAHAAQAWVLLRAAGNQHVYFLRGGFAEWNDQYVRSYFARGGC